MLSRHPAPDPSAVSLEQALAEVCMRPCPNPCCVDGEHIEPRGSYGGVDLGTCERCGGSGEVEIE